jgi:hypothetical protein
MPKHRATIVPDERAWLADGLYERAKHAIEIIRVVG